MNFQQVKEQYDKDQGQNKAKIKALLVEIKGQGFTSNQKPYMEVDIQDQNQEKHKVRLYGDKFPTVQGVNYWHLFSISKFIGNHPQHGQYESYSGFYEGPAQHPRGFHQPLSKPNPQKKQEPDWDKIAEGKVLCNVVCSAIQSGQIQVITEQDAKKWTDFIMSSQRQTTPSDIPYSPSDGFGPTPYVAPDDSIPF